MHKIYLDKIDFMAHEDKIRDIFDMLICDTKDKNYELYEHIDGELYEMAYGKKISKEMAEKWVKNMLPIGEYWDIEATTDAMNSLGYNDDAVDFYVVANMMKNDYNDLTDEDETLALKLAHDWLNDKDARDCKLYQYWKHIIKK